MQNIWVMSRFPYIKSETEEFYHWNLIIWMKWEGTFEHDKAVFVWVCKSCWCCHNLCYLYLSLRQSQSCIVKIFTLDYSVHLCMYFLFFPAHFYFICWRKMYGLSLSGFSQHGCTVGIPGAVVQIVVWPIYSVGHLPIHMVCCIWAVQGMQYLSTV